MTKLNEIRCVACEGGVPVLSEDETNNYLSQVANWQLSNDKKYIYKEYKFKGFYKTMGFVNAVAFIANSENHHPDMEIGYNYCRIKYLTHAVNGLTKNDFICAAKIDALNVETI